MNTTFPFAVFPFASSPVVVIIFEVEVAKWKRLDLDIVFILLPLDINWFW